MQRLPHAAAAYAESPRESERTFAPPDEFELFITRPLTPDLSIYIELEDEPEGVAFENARSADAGKAGFVKQALTLADLKPGWVVSVTTQHEAGREVAQALIRRQRGN